MSLAFSSLVRIGSALVALNTDFWLAFAIGIVVPKGEARIRVQLSAGHSIEQVDKCVDAFIRVGKRLGVVNWRMKDFLHTRV